MTKGSLYQRGAVWWICYYGPRPDGSCGRIRESTKTENREKAEKVLEARVRAVRNHRDGIAEFNGPASRRITLDALLDAVKADWELSGRKSLGQTLGHLERVREGLGQEKAMSLTPEKIRSWVKSLREGKDRIADATVNRALEVLVRAYRLAIKDRRLPSMAAPAVTFLPEARPRQGFFERDELAKVLEKLPAPLDAMARFAFKTGWRRGELLGLRWEWVDRRGGEIRIPDSKNGEGRMLPLDDELAGLVESLWEARRYESAMGPAVSRFVFHRNGRPITRGRFQKLWSKACDDAKLPSKLFHDFRRTAARNMVRAGVPETVAMSITGHKTRSMFDRYNISSSADQLEALRKSRAYVDAEKKTGADVVAHPSSQQ